MPDEDNFERMRRLWDEPLVRDYFSYVKGLSSFDMPTSTGALFTSYHSHFFDEPRPSFSADWGEASQNWRWQKRHSETIFDSVQSAVAATYYHSDNLLRIEREILAFPRRQELVALIGNTSFGGGNTRRLDFEYHGFIFAYRRSLDYLARGIASLLKQEFHSYRELPDSLEAHKKYDWVKRVIEVHSKYAPQLDRFLTTKDKKSARDLLAHYTNVPAGSLNVNSRGIFFAGGGEKLSGEKTLGSAVQSHVEVLEAILVETFEAIKSGFPKEK